MIDDRLMRPKPRAAGSLGIFRIVFGLFYLWHLSYVYAGDLARLPASEWRPVSFFWVTGKPAVWLVTGLESTLVILLVLLTVGLKTRLVTVGVLVLGLLIDGHHQSFGKVEHGTVLLSFYIPLVMAFSRWGAAHSLDSRLRRQRFEAAVSPNDSSWTYAWPARVILVILSALYFTAAWLKVVNGSWLHDPDVIEKVVVSSHVMAGLYGISVFPLHVWLNDIAVLPDLARAAVLLFEGTFFLSLFSDRLMRAYVSLALLFHAGNALLMAVTFTPVLIVYGLFVDWQGWLIRVRRNRKRSGRRPLGDAPIPVSATMASAIIIGLAWTFGGYPRALANLAGLVDFRTIWLLIVPAVLVVPFVRSRYPINQTRTTDGTRD